MTTSYLRTDQGLIDLRIPLQIRAIPAISAVQVLTGRELEGEPAALAVVVKESYREEMLTSSDFPPYGPSTDRGERTEHLLDLIADSLADGIAKAIQHDAKYQEDPSGWVVQFSDSEQWTWLFQPLTSKMGTKRVREITD